MISIDWGTRVIYIPKDDLTLIQLLPVEIRELNLNWFRLQLKDLEDSEAGMVFPDTHRHNTEVYLGGLTFARVIEIINGYTLTFEDGQYAVNLVGANSNVGDRVNVNQVSVRSSNSAGLISSPAIEYSSYNQGVSVDTDSSFTGTVFPVGTPQAPVNNLADAILICQYRGFDTIFIKRSMIIDSGGDYHGYTFIGESYTKTLMTITSEANVFECTFQNTELAGTLDGGSTLRNCRIHDLDYIDGIIEDCILDANGRILLSGVRFANIINCVSGRLDTLSDLIPSIDMGGSGTSLAIRNYSGAIQIINKNGPENIDIDLSSGIVILDSSVTNGTIQVRGSGQLINNSTGTTIVDSAGLISKSSIVEAIQGTIGPQIEYASFNNKVSIDVNSTYSGIDFPSGTPAFPVNNLISAKAIAVERGFETLELLSDLTIISGENIDEFTFKADNYQVLTIASGVSSVNTNFEKVSLYGELSAYWNILTDCWVYDITNFAGWMVGGSFTTVTLAPFNTDSNGQSFFDNIVPMYPEETSTIIMNTDTFIACTSMNGEYEIRATTSGSLASIGLNTGTLIIDSSCTGGDIIVSGNGGLIDNSTGVNLNSIGLMSKTAIVGAINDSIGPQIEYASFNDGVTIDTTTSFSGIYFPVGTSQAPVNNYEDARNIAINRGFDKFFVRGFYTFNNSDMSGYKFVGEGPSTFLTFNNCMCMRTELEKCTVSGIMSDVCNITATDCVVGNLVNFSGDLKNCVLTGTYILQNIIPTNFIDCIDGVPGAETPIIDFGLSLSIGVWGYNGGIKIINANNPLIESSINFDSGRLLVDPTVTEGRHLIKGVGLCEDNSTGNAVVDVSGLISKSAVVSAINNEIGPQIEYASFSNCVTIDVINGSSGIIYPKGTPLYPVNNLIDAVAIASDRGFNTLCFIGNYTFGPVTYISNYSLTGGGTQKSTFTFVDGSILAYCKVYDATITGLALGIVGIENCHVINYGASGAVQSSNTIVIKSSLIEGEITIPSNFTGNIISIDCWSASTIETPPILNFNNSICNFILRNYSGGIEFKNYDNHLGKVTCDITSGRLILDSTVMAGTFKLRGVSTLEDRTTPNSNLIIDDSGLISKASVVVAIEESIGPQIQYSSFNDGISIDVTSTFSGINYPTGTSLQPVNNLAEALIIAVERGFKTLFIKGNLTIGATDVVSHYTLVGEGSNINTPKTTITMVSGCTTVETVFKNAFIQGVQGGECVYESCVIGNITHTHCMFNNTILIGPMQLYYTSSGWLANHTSNYHDCQTSKNPFMLDYNHSPMSMVFSNLSGRIHISNCTDYRANITLQMDAGEIVIDSSCTAGNFTITGIGLLTNDSTAVVNSNGLMNKAIISSAVSDEIGEEIQYASFNGSVWIDTTTTASGILFPIGTPSYPVNNILDAKTIAAYRGFSTINILSDLTIFDGENIDNLLIKSDNWLNLTLEEGSSCVNTVFEKVSLYGVLSGNWNILINCWTYNIINFIGWLIGGSFVNIALAPYTVIPGSDVALGQSFFDDIVPMYPGENSHIVMNTDTSVSVTDGKFNLIIEDMTGSNTAFIDFQTGKLELNSSCVGGAVIVRGIGELVDNSNGTTVNSIGLISTESIAETIGDVGGLTVEEHNKLVSLPDVTGIGTIVTDTINEEIGPTLLRMLGLLQENQYLDNTTYTVFNGQKLLASGRIRTYSDALSVGTDTNIIATYQIATTWDGDEMQSYRVIKI